MTDVTDDREDGTPALAAGAAAAGPSVLDRIRQRRDERVAREHLDLPIPTWDGELIGRFKVVDRATIDRMAGDDVDANADFLSASCVGVYEREGGVGPLQPVMHDNRHVSLDAGLAASLGYESETVRELVHRLISGETDNHLAIGALADKVAEWMKDTSAEVEGQILGEA